MLFLAVHIYMDSTYTTNLNRIYCITNEKEITKEINTYIHKLNIEANWILGLMMDLARIPFL